MKGQLIVVDNNLDLVIYFSPKSLQLIINLNQQLWI